MVSCMQKFSTLVFEQLDTGIYKLLLLVDERKLEADYRV